MHLLVTRPVDDAAETAAALRGRGHDVSLSPLFDIQFIKDHDTLPPRMGAVVFTSRNSVRAFCESHANRNLVAYCVGNATARTAAEVGFKNVHSADGTARELVALIQNSWKSDNAMLLRVASDTTPDILDRILKDSGFHLDRRMLYTTPAVSRFTVDTHALLRDGKLDGVLFFSPRTATVFCDLIVKASLTEACRNLTAWCISPETAKALSDMHFDRIAVAQKPNQTSLLSLIENG